MSEYLLEIKGLSKSFPGVKALDKVDFKVRPGTVHSLMGENGAGKSTLMKCLFGIYSKDEGEIYFQGNNVEFKSPKDALDKGVAMVHQELNQVMMRPVMENMMLGRFPRKNLFFVDHKKMYDETKESFEELGININPKQITEELSVSQRQMIEIARAVSYNAKILILDEPTSSLTDREVDKLFSIIDKLKAKGMGIVYISHKMDEIMRISDDITVFRDGQYIGTERKENVTTAKIISMMVGRELSQLFPPKTNVVGNTKMVVSNLTGRYKPCVEDISFELKEGEILGIAGLVGSGRSELLQTIFGYNTKLSGDIYINGQKVEIDNPKQAIKNKIALITEERRSTGIFPLLNIRENAVIANLATYKKFLYLKKSLMIKDTKQVIDNLNVKTPSQNTKIGTLSGGNQQKVIIGRWLLTQPDILLLDEPTRGIDVGAKYEIYQLILDLVKENKSVIMVSSELPELIGICDRILVMSNYKLAGEISRDEFDQEKILKIATKFL